MKRQSSSFINLAELTPPKFPKKQFKHKVTPDMECSIRDIIQFVKSYTKIDLSVDHPDLTPQQLQIRNNELFPLIKQKAVPRGRTLYLRRDFAKEFLGICERMLPEIGNCIFAFPRAILGWQKVPNEEFEKYLQIFAPKTYLQMQNAKVVESDASPPKKRGGADPKPPKKMQKNIISHSSIGTNSSNEEQKYMEIDESDDDYEPTAEERKM